jgi:hypothetical protein
VARKQYLPTKPLLTRPDNLRKFYGANLAEVFRTSLYDCSLKNVSGVPDFALTRLKGGSMEMQRAPAYPEDRAMLICVALAPTPVDRWRARIAGQEVSVSHSISFATTVIDLMKPMEMWAAGPFDYLHYYVSRDLLDRVAADNRIAPVDSFRMVFFGRDLVVAQLTKTILSQVRNREPLNMLALEDVSLRNTMETVREFSGHSRAWRSGKRSAPRRCCVGILEARSELRTLQPPVSSPRVTSLVAFARALALRFINGSSSFESTRRRICFANPN